ncbi:hypothetical protein SK128_015996, partial [Halocaridina rubra]
YLLLLLHHLLLHSVPLEKRGDMGAVQTTFSSFSTYSSYFSTSSSSIQYLWKREEGEGGGG